MTPTPDETRRHLTEIPDLFALLPLFAEPGSGGEERRGTSNPSRPPVNLAIVDLTDTREKPDADPVRGDYDLDRRAGARRQGVLPTLASWTRLVDSELHDEGREHIPPGVAPCDDPDCTFRHVGTK